MSTRSLPLRPNLVQLKRQAKELQHLHQERKAAAAARIRANHPAYKQRPDAEIIAAELRLADAQLVIAREYGFPNWAALKHEVETANRVAQFRAHSQFESAVAAIDRGDTERLHMLLAAQPELVRARTNLEPPFGYFTGATLLHHIAWNPGRSAAIPQNVVAVARVLLDHGADVNALTLGRNAGTALGLIITSKAASDANVSAPLMDLLLQFGATLDLDSSGAVIPEWKQGVLDVALANHAPRAAEKLIELGADPDVCAAAALGDMRLLRGFFDDQGKLRRRPRRNDKLMSERDAIGLAALFAYVNRQFKCLDFLLDKDGNWNATGVNNGALLHRAAWDGELAMVQRLVAQGADTSNRDNPFNSTPVSWAQHNKQQHVFDWLCTNCAIDLHDAIGFNLEDHARARLDETPASVNQQLDHWEVPASTPLYWAAWTRVSSIDGVQQWDHVSRLRLVRMLLERGADPNIVAGDGHTALDVAHFAGATDIAALIERHGGKRGIELPYTPEERRG